MGLAPDVFRAMTPVEFILAQLGYMERRRQEMRQMWEAVRFNTYVLTTVQMLPKDRRPMTEMFPFEWDAKTPKSNELTPQERLARVRKLKGSRP